MRIFAAGLSTETNTFAPWPTRPEDFVELDPASLGRDESAEATLIRNLRKRAYADGHELRFGPFVWAEPSGPTLQPVYEGFRDRIVAAFRAHGPFDVVLLFLHGAMVATECDDCEGDLIAKLREVDSNVVIGVELDPHCHLTDVMVRGTDAIVLMQEYPHTDFVARAEQLYDICISARKGRVRPVSGVFDCRMVGFYPTTEEPMRGLLEFIREMEMQDDVLAVSFVHGFPWGDTAAAGSKVVAVTNGDHQLARDVASRVGQAIYAQRKALLPQMPDIEAALDRCVAAKGRIVLADTADNAGGGAPSDNVALLRAMVARAMQNVVFGCVWDPATVEVCSRAGMGARLFVNLGGKHGFASGDPLQLDVTVCGIAAHHDQQGLGDTRVVLGASVWIKAGGIDIVVSSTRTQTLFPDAFTGLGIDLRDKRVIAVKSSQHFRAGFAALADEIVAVATPGALQMDFAKIPYQKKIDLDFFPRVADPLGSAALDIPT